ncbi:hypothetical protein PbB2_01851 [Candidatus Phycosocius bacilliformis]|uniref:NAD-dependent epimerase/dehydratase domain-containing protein n=1 Tax=Candidatus Phycosocius bacilliformis TaxID=1445552 RepID=A0A2P2EAX0_9PROT|nr:NAD-dependent epimerase/dehydratase family protein [Candidatus Phycosocius bacilliformis]GBF58179.1 hypothetical protein PbB2_01851 [Candidatus Phycosocius bacilliformis]
MRQTYVIFGYGPVGQSIVHQLLARGTGETIRVAQRTRPADLPVGVTFQSCDMRDAAAVATACEGADQIVLAVGFAYQSTTWASHWPAAMAHVLAGAQRAGARLIFVDNLYLYGPQTRPLVETMPPMDYGRKPAVRAAITRQWLAAHHEGKVRVTALRAPDFYGPGVKQSHLGELGLAAIAQGKKAMLIVDPDQPHDFAYVPDIGRAVMSLLDADDSDFGQAWHVPSAPTTSPRAILDIAARQLNQTLKLTSLPMAWLPILGLVHPMMREMVEMRFQWDRPYQVDCKKFETRFWADPTSFERGVQETLKSFQSQ